MIAAAHCTANLHACPYCKLAHFWPNGTPYKTFTYVPLIPQLKSLFNDNVTAKSLQYQSQYFEPSPDLAAEGHAEAGKIKDIFDGRYYKHLLQKDCQVNGHLMGNFFLGKCDLALGLSSDGFSPFKKQKHSAWPLIVFNYNFSLLTQFWLNNILCLGVIPGPKAPKDIDSFLIPLVDKLVLLAEGIKTFDRSDSEFFDLWAHLIKIFGNMPAKAKLMQMKGHNTIKPCHMCNVGGLWAPGLCATSHYILLDWLRHLSVAIPHSISPIYSPNALMNKYCCSHRKSKKVIHAPELMHCLQCMVSMGILSFIGSHQTSSQYACHMISCTLSGKIWSRILSLCGQEL